MFGGRRSRLSTVEMEPLEELVKSINKIEYLVKEARFDFDTSRIKKSNNSNGDNHNIIGFVRFNVASQEEEMVELLRRVVELVVRGEHQATVGGTTSTKEWIESSKGSPKSNAGTAQGIVIFEHFCERNVLGLIINLVTGNAFDNLCESILLRQELLRDDDDENINCELKLRLLPPLSIATQAVQSISILLQNVISNTSLYFLLSNNKVNDLINLPLEDLYLKAKNGYCHGGSIDIDDSLSLLLENLSLEVAELTTHFISFLKSLAMRMNFETLQFFLTYPTTTVVDLRSENDDALPNSNTDSVIVTAQFPLYERALQFCSLDQDNFVRLTAMNICLNTLRIAVLNGDHNNNSSSTTIPLEEGNNNNDLESSSISSPTTTNNSLISSKNIIIGSLDTNGNVSLDDYTTTTTTASKTKIRTSPKSVPTTKNTNRNTSLHTAKALPFRERLAIAHHVCQPSRVEALVSPIFMKLAQLCGSLLETVTALDTIGLLLVTISEGGGGDNSVSVSVVATKQTLTNNDMPPQKKSKEEKKIRKAKAHPQDSTIEGTTTPNDDGGDQQQQQQRKELIQKRQRLVQSFRITQADLEDELLLLDDIFNVGLKCFNEQTVDMMLVTFIYPLLLQPLHIFMQRNHKNSDDNNDNSTSTSTLLSKDAEEGDDNKSSYVDDANKKLEKGEEKKEPDYLLPIHDDAHAILQELPDPDSSPVKISLLGITSIFHHISYKPLLHLLTAALLHPLSPNLTNDESFIVYQSPIISSTDRDGNQYIIVDSMVGDSDSSCVPESIHEGNNDISPSIPSQQQQQTNRNSQQQQPYDDKCNFVLSPGLSVVLSGTIDGTFLGEMRPNPYRQALLAFLAATDGMACLQSLAVFAVDVMTTSLDFKLLDNIIGGLKTSSTTDQADTSSSTCCYSANIITSQLDNSAPQQQCEMKSNVFQNLKDPLKNNYLTDFVSSVCASVMTSSRQNNGVCRMKFNLVAAHIVMYCIMFDKSTEDLVLKLMNNAISKSKYFLSQLPLCLGTISSNTNRSSEPEDEEVVASKKLDDYHMNLIMDRLFFDQLIDGKCIIEALERSSTDVGYDISVAHEIAFSDIIDHMCATFPLGDEDSTNVSIYSAPLQRCAISVKSYLMLDAFLSLLQNDNKEGVKKKEFGLSTLRTNYTNRTLFAPLSFPLSKLISKYDEGYTFQGDTNISKIPKNGSVVTLVGNAAFPCVCEVTKESKYLFSNESTCATSEGVIWKSLYLVLLGKLMILAEPEQKGSGGNGRIVTVCRLSSLNAKKDDSIEIKQTSSARRLLLTYFSPNSKPPGAFISDDRIIKDEDDNREMRIFCSHMDLWFEDENAAFKANKVLCSRILRDRSRRGRNLRQALIDDDKIYTDKE